MCSLNILMLTCLVISVAIANKMPKGSIGFPEPEEDPNLVNKDNRQPVFLPAMCPENELYYPGDQKDDWICDCRPAYLFHPKSDSCWPAYRKGPCEDGHYLVLKSDSAIPVCERNPCSVDSYVLFNGRCERLADPVPCRHLWPIPATLAVNSTTLAIGCRSHINFPSRFGEVPPQICPPGCKRSVNGKCVPIAA
ncbi:uncharacterized protein LOC113498730 isoform X1 [Trichoplusia ni]|uniref:Uncharacterized protein LOC113498730 isoform X1 n=1 Tax=Trichoplusia ni TaxID=7111 RepID=A0A7E5W226_TRINI|nr:uncharacterized protein LOC113498730 isoform X1 [Trichoplusia ni]